MNKYEEKEETHTAKETSMFFSSKEIQKRKTYVHIHAEQSKKKKTKQTQPSMELKGKKKIHE